MPTYKKLPRSKPKRPDEFISFFDRIYHEAYKRGPAVLATLAVLALVGIGVLFWREFHVRKTAQVSESIFDVSKKGKEEQEKTLHEIKKANLYSPLGVWASLELANRAKGEGSCDAILKELEPYVGHGQIDSLKALVYQKVGACYEDKKDFKKAEGIYEKAWSDSHNALKDWSYLRLASIKDSLGDKEGSQKILKEILASDSQAGAPVKEEARVALLLVSQPIPETVSNSESAPESKKSK